MRTRLDAAMVARGLASSRGEATELIAAGKVTVSGAPASKASRLVGAGEPIVVATERRWVGRGAQKLEHALIQFGVDVAGRGVVDAGSSTGGFTQCVLERGARLVVAIDVGTNQLHESLRADSRVDVREKTDIRRVEASSLPGPCSLLVADMSFISLVTVMPSLMSLVAPEAGHPICEMILLVKPQFEVGRAEASRARGVIRDEALRSEALDRVARCVEEHGGTVVGTCESPITGSEGNVEFLMHTRVAPRP
ncbi:MAG: TlyA family RNA methyltransferase [Actinomycetota bacterium]